MNEYFLKKYADELYVEALDGSLNKEELEVLEFLKKRKSKKVYLEVLEDGTFTITEGEKKKKYKLDNDFFDKLITVKYDIPVNIEEGENEEEIEEEIEKEEEYIEKWYSWNNLKKYIMRGLVIILLVFILANWLVERVELKQEETKAKQELLQEKPLTKYELIDQAVSDSTSIINEQMEKQDEIKQWCNDTLEASYKIVNQQVDRQKQALKQKIQLTEPIGEKLY